MTQDLVVIYVKDNSPATDGRVWFGLKNFDGYSWKISNSHKIWRNFLTALFLQLQLCHIYWLVTAQPTRKLLS